METSVIIMGSKISKQQYQRFLKNNDAKTIEFHYINDGNDVWNPCGTLQKETKYEFIVDIVKGNKVIRKTLVEKKHRRTDDIVENELVNQYSKWANEIGVKICT